MFYPVAALVTFEIEQEALETGHRAPPQVADRGSLYQELRLNTDTKLNKHSLAIFQGWSRRNNCHVKVLTIVPRATWPYPLRCL